LRRGLIVLSWILVVGWMGAVFYLSCLEEPDVPRAGTLMPDYVNHGAAYFLLAFLLFIALQRTWHSRLTLSFVAIVGWCLVFGLGMEFAQKHLTDTRHFSLTDWAADGVGAVVACLSLLALSKAGDKGRQVYALLTGNP
jgi:VanZ family protein